jgi:hypothetical protein
MTATLDAPVKLLGSTTPRLYTRPLATGPAGPCGCGCSLSPSTSLGFAFERFVTEIVGVELLPYQRWLGIHMLETAPGGLFRFRRVLLLISRQNGKTFYVKLLALFMLYMGHAQLVLGAAQSLDIAREAWAGAVDLAQEVDDLATEIETIRYANGEQCLTLNSGARYRITAATRGAGRGLSVDLLVLDELREHRDWAAWSALSKTTTARPNHLIVGVSNAGDDQSVVLNSLRATALTGTDEAMGLFEYSAPDGCELDDMEATAQANPALGYPNGVTAASLRSARLTDPAATYRTESMCMRVDALDAALDLGAWKLCADTTSSLGSVRSRVVACLDVAADGGHVTLAGAGVMPDGKVRVEVFGSWPTTGDARFAVPDLLARIKPAAVGWFPSGPAAALGAELRALDAIELKGSEVAETCQEFASLVASGQVRHGNDALLNAHISGTAKLHTGDGWRFARKGASHVDAAYAVAGAARIARTLPEPERLSRPICV